VLTNKTGVVIVSSENELTERKLKILQAIIKEYVKTAEPVGSRTLSRMPELHYSSATIRNEMSDLEEMGYLTHPHTSAGRVPSDKAYRLYVNELMRKPKLSTAEKREIADELQADVNEFDRTIKHATQILSRITNLTSFAVTPLRSEERLEYVKFLPVDSRTVVMMIVSESGNVSNTALKLSNPCKLETLELLGKTMTYNYRGMKLTDVMKDGMIEKFHTNISSLYNVEQDVKDDFMKTLGEMLDVQLYMDGLTNIFDIPEYSSIESAKNFIEMLDHKDDFLKTVINREDGTTVTIGAENEDEALSDYSMITATYKVNGKTVGKLGVIGPKRMSYGKISSLIEYLTENLNKSFRPQTSDPSKSIVAINTEVITRNDK